MASSNDVKSAQRVKNQLHGFIERTDNASADDFVSEHNRLLKTLQQDLSPMDASPVVSLA